MRHNSCSLPGASQMRPPSDSSSDDEKESMGGSDDDTVVHYPISLGEAQYCSSRTPLHFDESLALLGSIQCDIQKMRRLPFTSTSQFARRKYCRLSSSCPSLSQESDSVFWPADTASTQPLLATAKQNTLPSDGSENKKRSSKSGVAVSDESRNRKSPSKHRNFTDSGLRKSASLSSFDSDSEDTSAKSTNMCRNTKPGQVILHQRSFPLEHVRSTATLSVTDDIQPDLCRVSDVSSSIQKSLSTPSLMGAVKDSLGLDSGKLSHESEADDEFVKLSDARSGDLHANFVRDPPYLQDGRKQRRKRSSIFFRKKKDKEKVKKITQSLSLLQRGSQAVTSAKWLQNNNNNSSSSTNTNSSALHVKVSPPILDFVKSQKTSSDMEDPLLQYESTNISDPFDSASTMLTASSSFGDDADLCLIGEEAEAWSGSAGRKLLKDLTEKQIKRQEHIYEFIMTEKHHCLTLMAMQKVFADGMRKELNYSDQLIDRLFPHLDEIIALHLSLMRQLRARQRQAVYVERFGDLLLRVFAGSLGVAMRRHYGNYCASHNDSVALYKDLLKSDRRFQEFIHRCSYNPLLKKKGVAECILFVTHRVTKYPLLIEPLIKTSRDSPQEITDLARSLQLVKDILVDVNSQVAEKQKEVRLLEIYSRIDAKSALCYQGKKFRKSDLLSGNRKLMFEGVATITQSRGRQLTVQTVVMSDVIFFLHDNSQKYHFVSLDGKASVISLLRLLVREKAGTVDNRAIYLISDAVEPILYELECTQPRDKRIWMESISAAAKQCPYDTDAKTPEQQQPHIEILHNRVARLLSAKDDQLALLCEDKLGLHAELLDQLHCCHGQQHQQHQLQLAAAVGSISRCYGQLPSGGLENAETRLVLDAIIKEVNRLYTLLLPAGGSLSRSASSVGEHQSNAFISPALPKRAETFAGFDANISQSWSKRGRSPAAVDYIAETDAQYDETTTGQSSPVDVSQILVKCSDGVAAAATNSSSSSSTKTVNISSSSTSRPSSCQWSGHSQLLSVQLYHSLAALLRILSQTTTNLAVYHAGLVEQFGESRMKEHASARTTSASSCGGVGGAGGALDPRLNVKLEELRNLQDQLSKEKAEWATQRDNQDKWIHDKRQEIAKSQDQLRQEQADVAQQRELLYRQLEALRSQGILLSPNLQVVTMVAPGESGGGGGSASAAAAAATTSGDQCQDARPRTCERPVRRSLTAGDSTLPAHLISSINQQKATVAAHALSVRQELPMKLAKLSSSSSSLPPSTSPISSTAERRSAGGGSGSSGGGSGVQQLLPMRLSQESRSRHSTSGYQRLPPGGASSATPRRSCSVRVPDPTPSPPLPPRTATSPPASQQSADLATQDEVIFF